MRTVGPIVFRILMAGIAAATGCALYVWAAINDGVFDGLPSFIIQPLMGLVTSGALVALSLCIGGLLSLNTRLRGLWRQHAIAVLFLTIGLFLAGVFVPLAMDMTRPVPGEGEIRDITGAGVVVLVCFPSLVFCMTCFPNVVLKRTTSP